MEPNQKNQLKDGDVQFRYKKDVVIIMYIKDRMSAANFNIATPLKLNYYQGTLMKQTVNQTETMLNDRIFKK